MYRTGEKAQILAQIFGTIPDSETALGGGNISSDPQTCFWDSG